MEPYTNPKDTVLLFLHAINKEDFEEVKRFTAEDLFFNGVLGQRNGADAYINDMKKMLFKYDIQKVFVEENDVCVLYNIDMNGKKIFTAGIYHVEDSRIKTIQVVFDPRPLFS
jgi:limonene-1,2-epoxide hydrolase